MTVAELIEELSKYSPCTTIATEVTRYYFNARVGDRTYHFNNETGELDGWSDFVHRLTLVDENDSR